LPAQPVDPESIGRLFRYSLGLSAWKESGGTPWALRVNPSSGNLHPSEGYVMLPPMEGWSDRADVYHYCPEHHELELRGTFGHELFSAVLGSFPGASLLRGVAPSIESSGGAAHGPRRRCSGRYRYGRVYRLPGLENR